MAIALAETQTDLNHSEDNSRQKLALESGVFYVNVIDLYLGNKEIRELTIDSKIERVPLHARNLFFEGLIRFEQQLVVNKNILDNYRGNEVNFLLSALIRASGKSKQETKKLIKEIRARGANFVEPIPGAAILEVSPEDYANLRIQDIIHKRSHAIYRTDERSGVSFCFVQSTKDDSLTSSDVNMGRWDVKHEFHHLLWDFLEKSGFARKADDPEFPKAFRNFRDELAAYIVSDGNIMSIDIDLMVHDDNPLAQNKAREIRNFFANLMHQGLRHGVKKEAYIYAVLSSRSFQDLLTNSLDITPAFEQITVSPLDELQKEFDKGINLGLIGILYEKYGRSVGFYDKQGRREFKRLIRKLNKNDLQFSSDLIQEFITIELFRCPVSITDTKIKFDILKKFALTLDVILPQDFLDNLVREKLILPEETKDMILSFPLTLTMNAMPETEPEQFLRRYIRFDERLLKHYQLDDDTQSSEPRWKAYKRIIDTNPIMRRAFEKVKEEIISEGRDYMIRDAEYYQTSGSVNGLIERCINIIECM